MSRFDDSIALEEQPEYRDVPEFDGVVETLSNKLLDINNQLNNLSRNVNFIDEKLQAPVTAEVRKAIEKHQKTCVRLINALMTVFREISPKSRELQGMDDTLLNSAQRSVRSRIIQSAASALKRFNELQQRFSELESTSNTQDELAMSSQNDLLDLGSQQQQQQEQVIIHYEPINAEELEYQQNLIAEREAEIENIANGVEELNELFQDLSTLVTAQGDMVDNIESNLYSVASDMRGAHRALLKTERYQRRSRGICTWIFIIVAIVLLFVIMIILA